MNPVRWFAFCAGALLVACDPTENGSQPSPTLVLVDSVLLAENDSNYLGLPGDLVVMRNGSFLVADARNGTVHEYGADGRRVRGIGRRGGGPNEFADGPYALANLADSLLFAIGGNTLYAVHLPTGEFRWTRPVAPFLIGLALLDDRVVYQNIDSRGRRTFVSLAGAADSLLPGGPFPAPLGSHPVFNFPGLTYMRVAQLGSGDSIAVALQPTDHLFFGRYSGSTYDSIHVQVLNRQGSRRDLQEKFMRDLSSAGPDVYKPSQPSAITRLSAGLIAYVVTDVEFLTNHFGGRIFVSLVDHSRDRSCPDAQVPVPADPMPHVTFRGDTLLVLTQDVGSATDAPTVIRKYLINGDDCAWIPGNT